MHKFSRSHDVTYQECNFKGYMTYWYQGTGIVRKGLNLDQTVGQLVHAMLGRFLYAEMFGVTAEDTIDKIVEKAISEFRENVRAKGFDELSGDLELEIIRQSTLAEGMFRGWIKVRYPKIKSEFKILGVETERNIPNDAAGVTLMSKIDCEVQRLSDNEVFAGPEFKTTGWINDDWIESWRYDTQTLSHMFDVEKSLGVKPAGVMMEFLYKGMKRKSEDGSYTYYSPFLRAYRSVDPITGEEVFSFDASAGRRKGWEVYDPTAEGMKSWVERMPESVLNEQYFWTTVYRAEVEVKRWVDQVTLRQVRIKEALETLKNGTDVEKELVMLDVFPAKLDRNCFSNQYRKKCPYLPICYGEVSDPIESGVYVERDPHHPQEFED